MNELTILHISDLHIKEGDSYARDTVLKALIDSVAQFAEQGRRADLIAITGDLVYSGREYGERTDKFCDDLLAATGLGKNKARLLIVPGNHDADKDECDGLIRTLDSKEDSENHPDKYFAPEKRKRHFDKFRNFEVWYNSYFTGIRSLKPKTTCQPPEELEIGGRRVRIMLMNSALFAYPDGGDYNRLWVGLRCLDEDISSSKPGNPDLRIALLHHPLEWLNDAERANIRTILHESCDILLSGHLHATDILSVTNTQGTMLYSTAGACYQDSSYPKKAHFIKVKFDTHQAIIYPIRYESDTKRNWTLDTSQFSQATNYEGIFDLHLSKSVTEKPLLEEPEKFLVKSTAHEPAIGSSALRKAYLDRLLECAGQVSLSGIDPNIPEDAKSQLQLNAVYTALLTLTPEPDLLDRFAAASKEEDIREQRPGRLNRSLSALEQLERYDRLVLMGDPGSGKSTFVNFVAMCLAGELSGHPAVNLKTLQVPLPDDEGNVGEEAQNWTHGKLLPVRIILRDFAARGLPGQGEPGFARHLWEFIAQELKDCGLEEWGGYLKKEILEQGGLLLLDGLDEVPEADYRRGQIKDAILDFAKTYKKCRILVTSRTYAYQKQDWKLPGFGEAILAPFSEGQIRQFVDRWYTHTAELRGTNREDAKGRAVLLKQAIFNSERLQVLAERPLLLTLMASLHAWRGGELPEKRERLYADATELLLETWQKAKIVRDREGNSVVAQPSLLQWLEIDRAKMRALLNELAFEAHGKQPELRGTADIAENELVGKIMALTRANPVVNPVLLVEFLSQRAGLLIPRGNGVYTFPHRTFQEYLAACYLAENDYPYLLARLVRKEPNRWREAALLAGATAAQGTSFAMWGLVEVLLDAPAPEEDDLAGDWGALIAGQLIAESGNVTDPRPEKRGKLDKIRQRQVEIMEQGRLPAVERAAAGRVLGRIGDPRKGVTELEAMEFCLVPAGEFWLGDDPPRKYNLDYDYWISRFPVTNAQFAKFIIDGGYDEPGYWDEAKQTGIWSNGKVKGWRDDQPRGKSYDFGEPYNLPNHPVVGVTWYEALAFTRWLTQKWQTEGRISKDRVIKLTNELEWEKAARGGEQVPEKFIIYSLWESKNHPQLIKNLKPKRNYPWGSSDNCESNLVNFAQTGIGSTSAAGCFPTGISPYGVMEMSGNVWEWTRSVYMKYPYKPNDGREKLTSEDSRVLRGGSWGNVAQDLRSSIRLYGNPDCRYDRLGFRVVCVARTL